MRERKANFSKRKESVLVTFVLKRHHGGMMQRHTGHGRGRGGGQCLGLFPKGLGELAKGLFGHLMNRVKAAIGHGTFAGMANVA
jgi:hypothetical protein